MFIKVVVIAIAMGVFAVAFSATYLGHDVQAEAGPMENQCAEPGTDLVASTDEGPNPGGAWEPPSASNNGQELEEVHSIRVRTCFWTWRTREVSRTSCSNVRVNEGGGYYSYVRVCRTYEYTERDRQRHCYTEVTTHNYRHTMLPLDPSRPTIPLV